MQDSQPLLIDSDPDLDLDASSDEEVEPLPPAPAPMGRGSLPGPNDPLANMNMCDLMKTIELDYGDVRWEVSEASGPL